MFDDIRHKEVRFYDYHSVAAKDLLRKLLIKDPSKRLSSPIEIMNHKFFEGFDWNDLMNKQVQTPYKPVISDPEDTSHFDLE